MSIENQAPRLASEFTLTKSSNPEHDAQELERLRKIDRVTLGDLEAELWAIGEQLKYWKDVRDAAQAQIVAAKGRINAARSVLAELQKSGALGQDARYDRKMANATIEDAVTKLEFAEKRLKNADIQLKTWEKRKQEFPTAKLKKLRKEARLREQMSGRASGSELMEV
ncbi:MAG TPA: hypothetical protein VFA85_18670 [Terriglobales bacterium]|nr:hypothetical protein [Terriglobales bacterium]